MDNKKRQRRRVIKSIFLSIAMATAIIAFFGSAGAITDGDGSMIRAAIQCLACLVIIYICGQSFGTM